MALDEKRQRCIELLADGSMKISDIAKVCEVSRQTIYNWRQEGEFKAALDTALTHIKNEANDKITSNLIPVVNELLKMAISDKTEPRTKAAACRYIIDRCLGTPINSLSMEIDDKTSGEHTDALAEFRAFLAEQETKTEKENAN